MKRRILLATTALLLIATPVGATGIDVQADAPQNGTGKSTGKHNFDQWQTIKRLSVVR